MLIRPPVVFTGNFVCFVIFRLHFLGIFEVDGEPSGLGKNFRSVPFS